MTDTRRKIVEYCELEIITEWREYAQLALSPEHRTRLLRLADQLQNIAEARVHRLPQRSRERKLSVTYRDRSESS